MAKKSTRREPEPDSDVEDEDEAADADESDEAPVKKKGSARLGKSGKTSATGKRKSSDSAKTTSSAKSKALKDSGKRKAAAKDDEDEGEELTGSARRRRPMPAKKKNDQQMVVIGVSIISVAVLLAIIIVVFNKKRTPGPQRDENAEYNDFKRVRDEGMTAFREFNRAESQGNANLSRQKHGEAHQKLQRAMDMLEKILANKRGPDGMLPKEFEGYEDDLQDIATHLVDLEKRGTVHSSAGSGGGGE